MRGGAPAPRDERPRGWQYPTGVAILVVLAVVAYALRAC
jgi:hypothetical protein